MAGRGPAPKDKEHRQRRNVDPVPTTELRERRPKIPTLPKAKDRRPETRRWWETWINSAQARLFTSTDWEVLLMLVPLVDGYWRLMELGQISEAKAVAGELRLQQARLGATLEDRQRLRVAIELGAEAPVVESKGGRRRDPRLTVVEGGKSSRAKRARAGS